MWKHPRLVVLVVFASLPDAGYFLGRKDLPGYLKVGTRSGRGNEAWGARAVSRALRTAKGHRACCWARCGMYCPQFKRPMANRLGFDDKMGLCAFRNLGATRQTARQTVTRRSESRYPANTPHPCRSSTEREDQGTCSHNCSSLFWFRMESRSSSLSVSCSIARSSISSRASTCSGSW